MVAAQQERSETGTITGNEIEVVGMRSDVPGVIRKIKDRDIALIDLAKRKIKGKKEAEKVLSELETK